MAGDLQISAFEIGHCLGALSDGVLAELTRKDQAHSGLDLTGSHGGLLRVARDGACLGGDLLEQVVGEPIEDAHGVPADCGLRSHLLQYTEDVRFEARPCGGDLSGAFGLAGWATTSTGSFGGGGVPGGSGGSFLALWAAAAIAVASAYLFCQRVQPIRYIVPYCLNNNNKQQRTHIKH